MVSSTFPYWEVNGKKYRHFPKEGLDLPYGDDQVIWEVDVYEEGEYPACAYSRCISKAQNIWAVPHFE